MSYVYLPPWLVGESKCPINHEDTSIRASNGAVAYAACPVSEDYDDLKLAPIAPAKARAIAAVRNVITNLVAIRKHNDPLKVREASPTGDDYNAILSCALDAVSCPGGLAIMTHQHAQDTCDCESLRRAGDAVRLSDGCCTHCGAGATGCGVLRGRLAIRN